MMTKDEKLVDEIYDFIKHRYLQADPVAIKSLIQKHLDFGTCDILWKKDKIVAVCRWNVTQDGLVFDILDLFISSGEPGIRIMRYFLARNWGKFMSVKYVRFARILKYPSRKWRVYRIENLLKLRSVYGR